MQLSEIVVYPVKSAAGIPLAEARLDRFGIADDRRWMVVDDAGVFITQREEPRLALIRPALDEDGLELGSPGGAPLRVSRGTDGPPRLVRIWRDTVAAADCGEAPARWLSALLERPVRLVFLPESCVRPLDPTYGAGRRIAFPDGFPLLLIGTASLDDLNRRLAAPVPMNRFRPNVVVTTTEPFAEDRWRRIRIGGVCFQVAKPCERCTIPAVDQATAEQGKEPLTTLATYRRRDGKVFFGQNLVHEANGRIVRGDEVTMLESDVDSVSP